MMKKLVWCIVLSIALTACGGGVAEKPVVTDVVLSPPAPLDQSRMAEKDAMELTATGAGATQLPVEKKIIKEGSINFETGDVNATRKSILAALAKAGGYVSEDSESIDGGENQKRFTLNVRIPAKNFDNFLGAVSSTATKIDSKNIGMRDVTTEYIDTKTRLDNKKLLEKRYLELLAKAGKMSDVLEIENKLSDIRSDIESTQGQLNYMDKQVAYSSLAITFYTKAAEQVASGNSFGYKFKQALDTGIEFLQNGFFAIIALWPLWITVVIVYWLVRKRVRRRRAER